MEKIRLDLISGNPYQTRAGEDPEHIEALAEDIWKNGLLQVPVGRRVGERVQLAFGHNRLAAYKRNKGLDLEAYSEMPVEIRLLSDEQMALLAWSENEKRQQLTPIERALAIKRMMDSFGWTQQEVADKLDMARSTLANMLRLLNLPLAVKHILNQGVLSQRQALALLPAYELSDSDFSWLVDDPERSEFLQLARGGTIDSDTIRERIAEYLQALEDSKPKQLELQEEPETEQEEEETPSGAVEEDPDAALKEQTRSLIQPAIRYLSDQRYLANATSLQRKFRIGYTAGMRLIEELQKWNVLGEKEEHGYPVLVGKYAPKVEPEEIPPAPPFAQKTELEGGNEMEQAADLVVDVGGEEEDAETTQEADVCAQTIEPAIKPAPKPVVKPEPARKQEPEPKPEPMPETEKLTVTITWMDGSVILAAQKTGGMPLFRSLESLPLYSLGFTVNDLLPENWKGMVK